MSGPGLEPSPPRKKRQWLWYLLWGLLLYLGAVVIYFYLADLEKTGGAASMNWVVALLYKLGGKWLAAGLPAVIGTGLLILSYRDSTRPRE